MAAVAQHQHHPLPEQAKHDLLQPSAMPAPSPSISEQTYRIASRFNHLQGQGNSAEKQQRPNVPEKEDVFYTPKERAALNTLDTNTSTKVEIGVGAGGGRTFVPKVPTVYTTSIPRPPIAPDVFSYPQANATASTSQYHKRVNDENLHHGNGNGDVRPSKRRALDTGDTSVNANASNVNKDNAVRAKAVKAAKEAREIEQEKWRSKWVKSFPSLTFHFEVEAEEGAGKMLKARTIKMGAKAEQFFSAKVTHLIVKSIPSPTKAKSGLSRGFGLKGSPKNPFYDSSAGSSLAQKAESLGIKVWTIKKLSDILDRLAPVGQIATQSNSLSTLLADERLHGTRERDASAPRPDWYYFRPGSKYLLVEDATAKHRTVLVKEYQPTKSLPEFPVLHDSFLRIPGGRDMDVPINLLRERAYALYVQGIPWRGEQPPVNYQGWTEQDSTEETLAPDVQPYHQASGNSVVITSNIASTSTANYSPAFAANGLPALGANKDRAIMQMSKRVQVLKGNAAKAKFSPCPSSSSLLDPPARGSRIASAAGVAPRERTFMTHEQVLAMLRAQRAPFVEPEPIKVEKRIRNREKVEAGIRGIKDQDTSSGYCENCRLRYDDLSTHLESRKHRRFAENPDNFAELDTLLKLLQRQINPNFAHDEVPFAPCWQEHTKNEPCDRCMYMVDEPNSEPASDTGLDVEEWVAEPLSSQEGDQEEEEGDFFEESADR